MKVKNILFSYQNLLKREIEKKRYFSFLRKIFNLILKVLLNLIKKLFSKNFKNLDKYYNRDLFEKSLDYLFIYFNTDKGKTFKMNDGQIINSHNYSPFYEKYFKRFKNEKINLLEIGSHEGKGLASFFFYFPFASLVGANINPLQMKYFSRRIEEIFIDVSSKSILKNFANYYKDRDFDIIIDDASHNLKDIIQTFPILFKKVKANGFYVIEDIDQFKAFPNLNPNSEIMTPLIILEKLINKQDFQSPYLDDKDKDYLKSNIKNIYIEKGSMRLEGHNVSDIVFIQKKDIWEL